MDDPTTPPDLVSPDALVFPGDRRYEPLRRVLGLERSQRPPLVALPRSAAELRAAVAQADLLSLAVVVPDAAGRAPADLTGAMLVSLSALDAIDPPPGPAMPVSPPEPGAQPPPTR